MLDAGPGHTVTETKASGNLGHGIDVASSDSTTLTNDRADRNGLNSGIDDNTGLGIRVSGAQTNFTASGNNAVDNAEDAQCIPARELQLRLSYRPPVPPRAVGTTREEIA